MMNVAHSIVGPTTYLSRDLVMEISKGIFPYPLIQVGQYLLSVTRDSTSKL